MRKGPLFTWLTTLFIALPAAAAVQQTANVAKHSIQKQDSSVIGALVDTLEPGTDLALLSMDHPNGSYNAVSVRLGPAIEGRCEVLLGSLDELHWSDG
jgi:hypothetical protein